MVTIEPLYYLNPKSDGFFTVAYMQPGQKYNQFSYPLSDLPEFLKFKLEMKIDAHITQNVFSDENRQASNLLYLTNTFADLDTYKTPLSSLQPDKMVDKILEFCNSESIPIPSIVIYSGNGFYTKWFYDAPLPSAMLHKWRLLQSILSKRFASFGADASAKDVTKMLRLPGTTNTKTGKLAEILFVNKRKGKILRYDFDALFNTLVKTVPAAEKTPAKGHSILPTSQTSLEKMNSMRVEDIKKLADMRGYDVSGVPEGERSKFMYTIAICLALSKTITPKELEKELIEIGRSYCPDFTDREILQSVSSVLSKYKKGEKYKISNAAIIERLEITPEEEDGMKVIISKEEKRKRDAARKTFQRRNRGVKPRFLSAAEKRQLAVRLRTEGSTKKQIAKKLKVSERQVQRYLNPKR